jgi:hypothetical protein
MPRRGSPYRRCGFAAAWERRHARLALAHAVRTSVITASAQLSEHRVESARGLAPAGDRLRKSVHRRAPGSSHGHCTTRDAPSRNMGRTPHAPLRIER